MGKMHFPHHYSSSTMRGSGSGRRRQRVSTKVRRYIDKMRDKLHREEKGYRDVPAGFGISSDSKIQLLLEAEPAASVRRPPSLQLFNENDTVRSSRHVYYKTFTAPGGCTTSAAKRHSLIYVMNLEEMF